MKIQKLKYQKLNSNIKQELNEIYKKAIYPSRKQLKVLAKQYSLKLTKVENWFKYKRRSQFKKGLLADQPKKWFAQDKLEFLLEKFEENQTPAPSQYQEYSIALNANYAHVKNWFAHQRQKKRMQKMTKNCEQKELTESNQSLSSNESLNQKSQSQDSNKKEQIEQEEEKQQLNSQMSTPKLTIETITPHAEYQEKNELENINLSEAQDKQSSQEHMINYPQNHSINNNPAINNLLLSLQQNQEAYKQLNSYIWFRNQMMISKENYLKHLQQQYIKETIGKISLYNCMQQYSQLQNIKNSFFLGANN